MACFTAGNGPYGLERKLTNSWFRMYAEFANDPKVQMLSEAMQRRLVMLLCMRCSNDLVTLHVTEIAFQLRISDDDLKVTKELFVSKGFIDNDWNVLNWDKRQFRSDSSAERVSRHREKKKRDSNDDVTLQKRNSNALEQNRTEQNKPVSADAELFERFWKVYPRHTAKQKAKAAWLKLKLTADDPRLAAMRRGLAAATQSRQWLEDGGRYVPHAATWLAGGRWDDELAPANVVQIFSEKVAL